ncbi:MAG: right-handed parallel beta-helix repeat-containing protein [Armatimonadetes bacterium]|nr:right-handed parallel beta-helix repeat-containing protein [Armatimonadota bacterium]
MNLYVSNTGKDVWSGRLAAPNRAKTDGPFAHVERARDEIRKLKAGGPLKEPVTISVRGGFYSFSRSFLLEAQDSGTPEAPIVYRAYRREQVRLLGGATVPPEAFKPLTDDNALARLDPAVRSRVLQADLRALGIFNFGSIPVKYNGAPPVPELFFNDQPMTLARWPNEGWSTIAKIIDTGAIPRTGESSDRPGIFEYSGDRPARWNVEAGVWLLGYWCFDWYAEAIQVKSIDREKRQITLAAPSVYGVKQGNPSPRRWCARNVFEELDQPGEYYLDRAARLLYFLPPGDSKGARIVLSTLNAPVVSLHQTANLTLRGFVVEASLGNGIDIKGGSGNSLLACEIRNTRELGVNIEGGAGHRVEACDLHDTGTGGLVLSGGDRKSLTPGGHAAINNHIWRFSRHKLTYANAIILQGVGNRAAHNLIHDAPHQAIGIDGNDHVFEYNVVHHICTETDDCGAYYKGRNPSCRGNLVRYNFWHNIGSPMGHGNAAVYFDDGDGGDTVFGNVFFRCGEPGRGSFGTVFSHGGHDNLAENNVFIECKRALGSSPWNDQRWREAVAGGMDCFWTDKLLKEVDITKPPYTTHYPELIGFMDPPRAGKRVNRAERNLIVMCSDVSSGNWQVRPEEDWVTDRDPGFVNAAKGDFRLRPDSAVFKRLPGFKAIPFEKIGLYRDELRPAPPVEAWTYGPPKPLPPLTKIQAAAPRPRTGPPPVFRVTRAVSPITIDGLINPTEWNGADPARAMPLARDVNGGQASRQSQAWLAYDNEAFYLAVDNAVRPETKLDGNQWGSDDAVEVSLRAVRKSKANPIAVVRGYGNGFLQFGTTPNGDEEPKTMDPGGIAFKAHVPEPGRWIAEFRIPFRVVDVYAATDTRIAFNLTVRKTRDDLWLMWEGTRGHSYDVTQSGFIELAR